MGTKNRDAKNRDAKNRDAKNRDAKNRSRQTETEREREREVARTQCSSRRGKHAKDRCCPPGGGGVVIPFSFEGIRLRRDNLSLLRALSDDFGAYLKIGPDPKFGFG